MEIWWDYSSQLFSPKSCPTSSEACMLAFTGEIWVSEMPANSGWYLCLCMSKSIPGLDASNAPEALLFLQFKQALYTSTSPSSPSLTKGILQLMHSEVWGQTHQPHVHSGSPMVSDCMEFVAGVHQLFKDHSVWLYEDLAIDKLHRASLTSGFSKTPLKHIYTWWIWDFGNNIYGYVKALQSLPSTTKSPPIDMGLSQTDRKSVV